MRPIIIALCCFFSMFLVAQNNTITPLQMREDLDYMNKYLKKWHPTYYTYTSKVEMDTFYQRLKGQCNDSTSKREFMLMVRQAVVKVGCGHMGVSGATERLFLPLNVWILDNRVYVKSFIPKDSSLQIGDEIIEINNEKVLNILEKGQSILVGDALHQTYKMRSLESSFQIVLYLLYGNKSHYNLKLKRANNEVFEAEIKTVVEKEMPKKQDEETVSRKILIKGQSISLSRTAFDSATMVLDIDDFNGKKQGKTFKQVFKYLKKNKVQNLVIDLRDNGGGSVFRGNKLLTYLLDQPIIPFIVSRKPNLTPLNPKFRSSFFARITPVLFMLNPLQFPNKNGWNHLFPFFKKNTPSF